MHSRNVAVNSMKASIFITLRKKGKKIQEWSNSRQEQQLISAWCKWVSNYDEQIFCLKNETLQICRDVLMIGDCREYEENERAKWIRRRYCRNVATINAVTPEF